MSLPHAKDLATAYRVCDPKPLQNEELDVYYADLSPVRRSEAMTNVSTMLLLQQAGEFSTILFTGHRGCGKSTELRRLEREWAKEYDVIYLEADGITDINDLEYTDLYLLVAQYVEFKLRQLNIAIDPKIIRDLEEWFTEITKETQESVETSIALQGELSVGGQTPLPIPFMAKLLAKIMSGIKGGSSYKTTIREKLEKDFSRLKTTLNLLLDDGQRKLRQKRPACKGLLLIFDNLDRCPPHVAEKLFFDYGAQLQDLNITLVYTLPISAMYSPRGLTNNLPDPKVVPMVNIYHYDPHQNPLEINEQGIQSLIQLLQLRMDTQMIFESDPVLRALILASGGHVRHLMQMVREACLTAIGRKHQQVEMEDAEYATKQLQFAFERMIPATHYASIADTYREKRTVNDEIGPLTLFNTSVLEYNGNQHWTYPHPMVIKIDAFQQALNPQP